MSILLESHHLAFSEEEVQEEIGFVQELLKHANEDIKISPSSLGAFFDDSLRLFGFKVFSKYPLEEIVSALNTARDYGVGLFIRGNENPSITISINLDGHNIDLPGGTSEFNTALHWLSAYGIALTLRDDSALDKLYAYHPGNFEGEYDEYHITLAKALIVIKEDTAKAKALLDLALTEANNATVFPDRAKIKGIPLVKLVDAVLFNKVDKIIEYACEALRGHYQVSNTESDSYLADLYIPYLIVGLCSIANDRGVLFDIDCGYLPKSLVDGSFL